MNIELRMLDGQGVEYATLPDYESLSLSPVFCDGGAVEFSYPKDGANWDYLSARDEFSLSVRIDGEKIGALECIVMEVAGDDAEDSSVWKFTGFFNNGRLAEAHTYPKGWGTNNVDTHAPELVFENATAGTIVSTLIQQAHDRGGLLWLTAMDFSGTADSKGAAWDKVLSISYAPGVNYLTVLRNLVDQGMCEFEFDGPRMKLYNADTMSADRTIQATPLVFRKGRDLTDSPRKRSTREIGTAMLLAGADGIYVETRNNDQILARRRVENYESQGNIGDVGSLLAIGQARIQQVSEPRMEKTHGLVFEETTSPRPIRDFIIGDWAYSDMGSGLERLRIKQWVLAVNATGEVTGSVTMNDFFAERADALSRRVDGIVGGSSITGASRAVDAPTEEVADTIAPATPAGVGASSSAYVDSAGQTYAQVSATWSQVTANSDGTILEDLRTYLVAWRPTSETGWRIIEAGTATSASWSPVAPGVQVEVRVAAQDKTGNTSDWSASYLLTSGKDVTPPPVPSTPLVDNYLGLLRIRWDGKFVSNAAIPPDFLEVEVHSSSTNNFTPDDTTRVGTLTAAGSVFLKTAYGVAQYARLIASDRSKPANKSAASATASGTPTQLVATDIANNIIGLDQVTFKDQDNLVEDGSFRIDALTTARAAQANWQVITADVDGSKALRWNTTATKAFVNFRKGVPVTPGEQYMGRFQGKAIGPTAGSKVALNYTFFGPTGATVSTAYASGLIVPANTAYVWSTPAYVTIPAGVVSMDILVQVEGATAGSYDVDQVEVRRVIGTSLIQDAAISTAKIADLSVNTAKISELSVARLSAGIMAAEFTVSGRIATALTGRRVEMNGVGFQGWDTGGNQTISLDGLNNLLSGVYKTALSGRRIEFGSSGYLGQIDFWSPSGLRTFIRSFTESDGKEALQIGHGDPNTRGLDERINLNTDGWYTSRFRRHDFISGEYMAIFSAWTNPGVQMMAMDMKTQNTTWWSRGGWNVMVEPAAGVPVWQRFSSEGVFSIELGSAYYGGRFLLDKSIEAFSTSPLVKLFTSQGYGGFMRFNGNGSFQEMEFKYYDSSFFINARANAFINNSDERTKEDIADSDIAALDQVRATTVKKYKRTRVDQKGVVLTGGEEIGLIAQEAPEQIVRDNGDEGGMGIDLYQYIVLLHKSIQELADEIDGLKKGPKK